MAGGRWRIGLEAAASIVFAVLVYWSLGQLLRAVATPSSLGSEPAQALSTLLIFLSPGYLGPLLVIALASSLFALLSSHRTDPREADTTGPGARHRERHRELRPGGKIEERSAPVAVSRETDRGRREERAAGRRADTAQEADPAAHPVFPRP